MAGEGQPKVEEGDISQRESELEPKPSSLFQSGILLTSEVPREGHQLVGGGAGEVQAGTPGAFQ